MKVENSVPLNIEGRYRNLYLKKNVYDCPKLAVSEYKNVFVSHEGLCWKNFRLLPYSTFNINSSYDVKHGWEFYRLVTEQYIVSTFGTSLKKIHLDTQKNYAVIHTKWFNYSFWMTSSLVRLQMLYDLGKDFILLYPEEWDTLPFVQATLRTFPKLKIERIPAGIHVQVPHLLLPEVRPFTACLNEQDIKQVAKHICEFYKNDIAEIINTPKKIFVNRKKANCRKIDNETQIKPIFEKYDFVEIDFDDMTLVEQIAYTRNAEQIVMLHGAGMTNVMFANPGTKILELMHEYTDPCTYRFIYWFLSVQNQCDYFVQFCKTQNTHFDEWRKDLVIEADVLERNLSLMLK
ncbi:MAG: glycosyltransferase family 61 protein [Bacteroidales bacterium]|nr:glycosyltransferase family 61 protein [Bacteroidales bacterium]